ncbi:MAG: hypothetical protein QMD50_01915 [Patescibacteria group bacterium]|nr:hypothetical protein [Patescibacteria group bacterium]
MREFFKPTLRKILITFSTIVFTFLVSLFFGELFAIVAFLLFLIIVYVLGFNSKKTVWFLILIWVVMVGFIIYTVFQAPPIIDY